MSIGTIKVNRPAMAPKFFTEAQKLFAEDDLPGFSVARPKPV